MGTSRILHLSDRTARARRRPHQRFPRPRHPGAARRRCLGLPAHPGVFHRQRRLYDCRESCGRYSEFLMRLLATWLAVSAIAMFVPSAANAEENSECAAAPRVLWGDGVHDDTAALNAWFRGEKVLWAETHQTVGGEIADRTFLLSSTVYVAGGTGLRLEHFRMIWPGARKSCRAARSPPAMIRTPSPSLKASLWSAPIPTRACPTRPRLRNRASTAFHGTA